MPENPSVSIIIRSKNEERWIGRTLKMLMRQSYRDFEVILVDNGSTDHTVAIAQRFPVKVLTITEFRPGKAINDGIRAARGKYLAILSAHCIPRDEQWLERLVAALESHPDAAGAYGRQLPFAYSSPLDKRDLLITFGLDPRVQRKDSFFHNANSLVRRDVWERIPFDEELTNIEDRVWGKAVIEARHSIVYEPEAAVFHYHGIHQNRDERRARSIVRIMENLHEDARDAVPEGFAPDTMSTTTIVPVLGPPVVIGRVNLLERLLTELSKARHVRQVVVLAEDADARAIARKCGAQVVERPPALGAASATLEEAITYALRQVEQGDVFFDTVLYVDHRYPFRPEGFFDHVIEEYSRTGVDSLLPTAPDHAPFWVPEAGGTIVKNEQQLKPRGEKPTLHRGLVGLGTVTSSEFVRAGRLVGDNLALFPVDEPLWTLRATDRYTQTIIQLALERGLDPFKVNA